MKLNELNQLTREQAVDHLLKCCGSKKWAEQMADTRPFISLDEVYLNAESIWWDLKPKDWLEAFSQHPKIGDPETLRAKFADTEKWAGGEQKGVQQASEEVLMGLAAGNDQYEQKFGYIFIVCATGKSADEMLETLEDRIQNDPDDEIKIAAKEQSKITKIRLEKLLT